MDTGNDDQSKAKTEAKLDLELKWGDEVDNAKNNQSKTKSETMIDDVTDENQEHKATEQKTVVIPEIIDKQVDDADDTDDANGEGSEDNAGSLIPEDSNAASNVESRVFIIDTNTKIGLGKISPEESESSSLDGRLVYSDVEVPEIEDKELMDEIDAQICDADSNSKDTEVEDEAVSIETALIESETDPIVTDDVRPSEQIIDSVMDVDTISILDLAKTVDQPGLNDTLSSSNVLETSSYEVNKEHKLAKPDVMIEIPTQEFIESLDDSGDMSDDTLQYDEDLLLNNDEMNTDPVLIEDRVDRESVQESELQTNKDVIADKGNSNELNANNKDTTNTLCDDDIIQIASGTNEEANTILQLKDIEVKTKSSEFMDKLTLESDSENDNSEITGTNRSEDNEPECMDIDKSNEVSHADIILEASHCEPILIAKAEDISHVEPTTSTEIKQISSLGSKPKNTESMETSFTDDVKPTVVTEVKEVHDVVPQVVAEVKESISTSEKKSQSPTKLTKVISTEEMQPQTPKEVTSTAETKPLDTQTKEASIEQPSTSKYMHQESSDEDQEVTDSLGLLAESSRVMDDEDEQEQDDDDDDDDFDQDDESNQMTAEHSEDSNAQHSETEVAREVTEVDESNDDEEKEPFFQIAEVLSATDVEISSESELKDGMEATDETEVEKAVQSLLDVEENKMDEEKIDNVPEAVESADDTVKMSEDTFNSEASAAASQLRKLLMKDKELLTESLEAEKTSPSKAKKLEISKPKNEISIVDLEESSSEDDIQEVHKKPATPEPEAEKSDVTTVNIPDEVEVMSTSAGNTSEMRHGEGEVVISGLPKPPPHKPARLNTGEVTIKTAVTTTESLVIPETKTPTKTTQNSKKPTLGLEIFSLDSDDDETPPKQLTAVEIDKARATNKCINVQCSSGAGSPVGPAGPAAVAYYGGRPGAVCRACLARVTSRTLSLIEGIKDLTPLLSLDMGQTREELVEISDSDSDEEASTTEASADAIGEAEATFLDEQLASMFNKTWKKFNMDARLSAAENEINLEVKKLEEECKNINTMLNECQIATDKLRNDLYDSFAGERKELPAILIYDTPSNTWSGLEEGILAYETTKETRQSKRRSSIPEPPAKRAAIPLGYKPLDSDVSTVDDLQSAPPSTTDVGIQNDDDNADISVVKLSAESAPAGLPPPGTASRPPLRAQMTVYAMRNAFGSWSRARILDVQPKVNNQFTMCRVKFEHKVKNPCKLLQARCLAYEHPSEVRMTIGTRLIALFKDNDNKRESYYSGIVAEIPNPVNNYRYLVFFDDGYAQYVQHAATRLVCEYAPLVWDEVHPFSRQFVLEYLRSYPERPMVRVHAGQSIKTEYNGKWWVSRVVQVDASLVQVHFEEEDRTEWIYRGSTRLAPLYLELQAAERQRARPLPRAQPGRRWSGLEEGILAYETTKETRQSKRRSSIPEPPAKRAAIPLGYKPLDSDVSTVDDLQSAPPSTTDVGIQNDDDNADISVVKLSAESAPAGLPPPGTASRPPLRAQMTVYAMRNAFGSWSRARILDVQPKVNNQFTMCRVKFEHKVKNPCKLLQARCLAYEHPSEVRMTIGTRLIALFKDNDNKRESYYSGIVAEIPNPVNNYRYLVFFDDGYAQYVQHAATRLVCEYAPLVWDEVHPFSRQFVLEYLRSYPERPMVRVHAGQSIKTEYNGKWWVSRVVQVDASLVQVHFEEEDRTEWIYRGSTRLAPLYLELQAAERQRARPLPRAQPGRRWSGLEEGILAYETTKETRQSKRRSSIPEPPAKRAAIPLGYKPLDSDVSTVDDLQSAPPSTTDVGIQNDDDNADISVVKLSAESAPAGLPPPGTASRPPLRAQMTVYAMRNAFGSWSRARILDVQPKVNNQFTMCRVKFEHKVKNPCKLLQARCLAYEHPSEVRMTIGTRLIALFKDNDNKRESYYSGIVAEIPNPVNNYRYLVFFDDGYAQYVQHAATRLVCEYAPLVWDEVHPFSRQFVLEYLRSYPERPMVRVHAGQSIKTEYNGKWWVSRVVQVDASLVQVHFEEEDRTEWIYRGSTRLAPLYLELQAAERQRARPLPRAQPGRRFNMPYVEYTRSDDPAPPAATPSPAQIEQDIRRQRAVAKKSTAQPPPPPAPAPLDGITSRVVFYTPKNAIKPHKMVPHTCGPRCKRSDVLALRDLRTYNPLTKPLLSGWERQIVKYRWTRSVMYRAPCGRRLRNYQELHRYLQTTGSDMGVDLFDFGPNTHCLAEFVLNKCLISKKDLSHGKENVPVPCVNYYDESLPEFCSYNTERTPTAGVPLNLDPEFLCGCDCTDDCADKSKCACWKMTLEGARTIGLDAREVGYVYKRLPEPLPSGIYECNSRCKCRQTCLNRVAQHPLQLKLQVFKTLNRGWGIRALNDIPKGAFLCVYAGNLLTDATANLDGLNEGDEYLAELDYIEVVEQMKEGFEEDIPDADKRLDKKDSGDQEESSSTTSSSEEEEDPSKEAEDDDFRPAAPLAHAPSEFSKRLRKRERSKRKGDATEDKPKDPNAEDNCITISDDEELREPARFAAQAGMGEKGFVSKYKSVRAHFGKDEACYIMDAKVQGNIGRYLNHSCTPNVFVQNVFVDTHDPRFPWVAFFALAHIRAGTELTWNYNYDVGSVPGKVLYCHCAAPNCRGRLL